MAYTYETLDTQSIRLLRLLSGNEDDIIQCSILPCTLRDADRLGYCALSYTWGTPGHYASIQLEDFSLPVQANPYAFLKVLRLQLAPPLIWVDAVCIN